MHFSTFEEAVGPALEDMILRGALRNLEVRFCPSRPGAPDALPIMTLANRPNARLLRLLADPYLQRRAAEVYWGHAAMWCAFHKDLPLDPYRWPQHECLVHPVPGMRWVDYLKADEAEPGTVAAILPRYLSFLVVHGPWIPLDVDALIREFGGSGGHWDIIAVGGRVS